MKILVVSQYFYPEQFKGNDLVDGLVEKGHEVTVFTGLPNYPKGKFYDGYSLFGPYTDTYNGKVKIIRSPLIPRGNKKSIQLIINYFSFFIIGMLTILFRCREKYNHIFIYQLSPVTGALPAVTLRFFKRIPTTMWVTDLWPESLTATNMVKNKQIISLVGLMVKFIYKNVDQIVVSSHSFIEKIHTLYKPKKPIIFWPQWAEDFFFEENIDASAQKEQMPDGFKLMFAGNIGTSQSFDTLVGAAEILKGQDDIHWVIVGDGLDRKRIEALVKEKGLESKIHFLGSKPVTDMPKYYSCADALLVSLTKKDLFAMTIPGKLQTCMASGKAIIGSIDGEAAWVINESKSGFVSPADDEKGLADNILKLYNLSLNERNILGQNGKDYCLENFHREHQINKLIKIMEKK
jgi:colanic acid biosynthesis glycosyl transferase WcaI